MVAGHRRGGVLGPLRRSVGARSLLAVLEQRRLRGVTGLGLAAVEAGGDDGDPDLVAEGVVDDGAEDDVGVLVDGVAHQACRLVDLEQPEVGTTGDRQQHAASTLDRGLEQRAGDGHLRRSGRTRLPTRRADAHQRGPGIGHDRLDVGEVEVDQARRGDEVGDARDTLVQHLVGLAEGVQQAHVGVADGEQPVVGDDDERVDLVAQRLDAVVGLGGAVATLEGERPGDDADGQRSQRAGDARDHRSAAGARAATFAGGHEDHVGALDGRLDLLGVVLGGTLADVGIGAGAETTGGVTTDVELDVGVAHQQRLRVGVDRDELDALEADLDHPVHGVDAAAADADDLDHGEIVLDRHVRAFLSGVGFGESVLLWVLLWLLLVRVSMMVLAPSGSG